MYSFIWLLSIIALSHHAIANPLPVDLSLESNSFSDNAFSFNGFETPSSIPGDFSAQTLQFSDATSMQPLDTSWLTDFSASPADSVQFFADSPASPADNVQLFADSSSSPADSVQQLFADSSDTSFEISLFPEPSDVFLESSCGGGDADANLKALAKRDDSDTCNTLGPAADSLPLLELPDIKNIFGPGIEKRPSSETFPILPIPGFTIDDDQICGRPRRRLCCQGPIGSGAVQGVVGSCRGIDQLFFCFLGGFFESFAAVPLSSYFSRKKAVLASAVNCAMWR